MNKIYINILPNKNPSIPGELSARFPLLENKLIDLWTLNLLDTKTHVFKLGVVQQVVIPISDRMIDVNRLIDSAYSVEVFNCICQTIDSRGNVILDVNALGICLEQVIRVLIDSSTTIIIHEKYRDEILGLLDSLKITRNVKFVTEY